MILKDIIFLYGKEGQALDISLRSCTETEYDLFFQGYVSDPLMVSQKYVYNREVVARSYEYNYHQRENYANFGIFLDNHPVGLFQLKRINSEQKKCEFGIVLQNDSVKNRGIGTAAVSLGIEIARKQFGIETLIGDTNETNARMRHVFEKLGFQLSQVVPAAMRKTEIDPTDDLLIYELKLTKKEDLP